MIDTKVTSAYGRMGTRADPRVYIDFTLDSELSKDEAADEEYLPPLKVEYRTWIGSGSKTNWTHLVEYTKLKFTDIVVDVSSIPYATNKNIQLRLSTKNIDSTYSDVWVVDLDNHSFLEGRKSNLPFGVRYEIVDLLLRRDFVAVDFNPLDLDYFSFWQKPLDTESSAFNTKVILSSMTSSSKARAFTVLGTNNNSYDGPESFGAMRTFEDSAARNRGGYLYNSLAVVVGLSLTDLDTTQIPGYPVATLTNDANFRQDAINLYAEWSSSLKGNLPLYLGVGDESLGGLASTALMFEGGKDYTGRVNVGAVIKYSGGIRIPYSNTANDGGFWQWVESVVGYQLNVGSSRPQGSHPVTSTGWSAYVTAKDSQSNGLLMLHNFRIWPPEGLTVMDYNIGGKTLAELSTTVPSEISSSLIGKAVFLASGDLPTPPTKDKGRFQGGPGILPHPGRTDSDGIVQPSSRTPKGYKNVRVLEDSWSRYPCIVDSVNLAGSIRVKSDGTDQDPSSTVSVRVPSGANRNPVFMGMVAKIPSMINTYGEAAYFKVESMSKSLAQRDSPFSPGQEYTLSLASKVGEI